MEECRGGVRGGGIQVRLLFQDDRMTPAVLAFLRETKIGRMINLASLEVEEERGVGDTELRACGPKRGRGAGARWEKRAGQARS